MKKNEVFSSLGHLIALIVHFLLNLHIISLFLFCLISLIPPICFAIAGRLNKDRAFVAGQAGWFFIAVCGVIKNF